MNVDAPTLSTIAAFAATAVAATLAAVQFYVGRKQADAALTSARAALMNAQSAGRHTVAEFRQKWIDKVIETLCEYHSIVMARDAERTHSAEESRALSASRTKLEILLNPEEADTVALLAKMDAVLSGTSAPARGKAASEMLSVARRLLKREWVRIKEELR
jgi:hypothetical protein